MSIKKAVSDEFSLGSRFRKFRRENNLTQQELADSIGLSQNYVSAVESNKENLSKPVLLLLNHLYRIKQEWLLTGEGPMYAEKEGVDRDSLAPKHEMTRKIAEMVDDMDEAGRQHIFDHIEATQRLMSQLNNVKKHA